MAKESNTRQAEVTRTERPLFHSRLLRPLASVAASAMLAGLLLRRPNHIVSGGGSSSATTFRWLEEKKINALVEAVSVRARNHKNKRKKEGKSSQEQPISRVARHLDLPFLPSLRRSFLSKPGAESNIFTMSSAKAGPSKVSSVESNLQKALELKEEGNRLYAEATADNKDKDDNEAHLGALRCWHTALLHCAGINSFASMYGSKSTPTQDKRAQDLTIALRLNLAGEHFHSWRIVLLFFRLPPSTLTNKALIMNSEQHAT